MGSLAPTDQLANLRGSPRALLEKMRAEQRACALRGKPYVPGNKRFAEAFGVDERTIRRWVRELRAEQKILRLYRGGRYRSPSDSKGHGARNITIVRAVAPSRVPEGLFGWLVHPVTAAREAEQAELARARAEFEAISDPHPDTNVRVRADHSVREGSREQSPDVPPTGDASPERGAPDGRETDTAPAAPETRVTGGKSTRCASIAPAWVPYLALATVWGTWRAAVARPYGAGSPQDRTVALAIGRDLVRRFGRPGAPEAFAFGPRELARARRWLAWKFSRYLRDGAIEDHTLSKARRFFASYGAPPDAWREPEREAA